MLCVGEWWNFVDSGSMFVIVLMKVFGLDGLNVC